MPGEEDDWVVALRDDDRDEAVRRLHDLLLRVTRAEVRRRSSRVSITGPELDDLAQQAADDAVVAILTKLEQFRGESRFTTWAYKFAVLEVSSKLARHFWKNPGVTMDVEDWERLPDRFGFDPAEHAQWQGLMEAVRRAVEHDLSTHQRRVFVALVLDGVPLDALAVKLGSNRNAIYKTMFDARAKLRGSLTAQGYVR